MKQRLTNLLFFLIPCFLLSSCDVIDGKKEYKTYIIPKGGHKSNNELSWFRGDELRFLAKFDHTACYSTVDPYNQEDVNKLYGISDCGDGHHRNSARFAWRWFNDKIEIFAYCYKDKERISIYLASVDPEEEQEYKIKINENEYVFSLKGETVVIPRSCSKGSKYYLFPFFGGDEIAPHDISIKIKEL